MKLLVEIRSNNLMKLSYWPTKDIFEQLLFEEGIPTLIGFEIMFMALGIITKNSNFIHKKNTFYAETDNENDSDDKPKTDQEIYQESMNSLFISTIDFYDTLFDKLFQIVIKYEKKSRNLEEMTKKCLKQLNVLNFFKESGSAEFHGSVTKRKQGVQNCKFFRILLFYSRGFEKFIDDMGYRLASQNDELSQIIKLLKDMSMDVKSFKEKIKKQKEDEVEEEESSEEVHKKVEDEDDKQDEEEEKEEEEEKMIEEKKEPKLAKFLKNKPQTKAIYFDNEQLEEEGYMQRNKALNNNSDENLKSYFKFIEQFQYEDEYDDSMNIRQQENFQGFGAEYANDEVLDDDEDIDEYDNQSKKSNRKSNKDNMSESSSKSQKSKNFLNFRK